jgi:hypothetical protein
MLAQDPVTGQLYEVPDNQPYGTGYAEAPTMMYDGLGNPVGWAFLAPLAAKTSPVGRKTSHKSASSRCEVCRTASPKIFTRYHAGSRRHRATVRATGRTSSLGQEALGRAGFRPARTARTRTARTTRRARTVHAGA